jgi:hypothetical protein
VRPARAATALVLALTLALDCLPAPASADPAERWVLFDHGRERGWRNLPSDSNVSAVDIIDCENPANKDHYRITFLGGLEQYAAVGDRPYWLVAESGPHVADVYVHTAMAYYEYLFTTTIAKPPTLADLDGTALRLCARAIGYPEEHCATFAGRNLSEVIADLCAVAHPLRQE